MESLPTELIYDIIDRLDRPSLCKLSYTSRNLRSLTLARLFESIVFYGKCDYPLSDEIGQHVRGITCVVPFSLVDRNVFCTVVGLPSKRSNREPTDSLRINQWVEVH